jgi:hypothetical protein
MDQAKIFFSYFHADASNIAKRLYHDLQNAGVNVIGINEGIRFNVEIKKEIKDCSCVLSLVSKMAVESLDIMDQVYYAVDNKKQVVLLILSPCAIPFGLRELQRIDFTSDYKKGFNSLLQTLNIKI